MLSRHYAKLCDVADFSDATLARLAQEVAPWSSFERPHRKAWELAMAAAFLQDLGLVDVDATVLDVGAGTDPILFWLAARRTRVIAVDTYGRGAFASREGARTMLEDPRAHAHGIAYDPDLLDVRDMDARALDLPDASVDGVVSLSSIEHFGGRRGVEAAAREMARVLRPEGHAFVVTECFVRHGLRERAPVQFAARLATLGRRCSTATLRERTVEVLTAREVQRWVIDASGLELVQPISLTLSPASYANVQVLDRRGQVRSAGAAEHPHVLMRAGDSLFTSLALPLRKPAA
ncbi:MAG: class SAM-dependent methyltransferase [Acidimicrobiales bacterium]|nr:class SAM-dependent methyltransferase [Acidimicrobiales bacterium]